VTGLISVVAVTAVLAVALVPMWGRRHMSARVSRYLRLHWSSQSRDTRPSMSQGDDDREALRQVPHAEWTALDDHQLTRLLRDSSP
jgi:hypothetical protein